MFYFTCDRSLNLLPIDAVFCLEYKLNVETDSAQWFLQSIDARV